ncbi:hypothetical protein AB0F93_03455 [Micromonospora tulbaghiae]|uniref:hypothetical protein n=1 Tax=Micromonospora tulbaghiae TaxID=479978 RepID=UPI0033189394
MTEQQTDEEFLEAVWAAACTWVKHELRTQVIIMDICWSGAPGELEILFSGRRDEAPQALDTVLFSLSDAGFRHHRVMQLTDEITSIFVTREPLPASVAASRDEATRQAIADATGAKGQRQLAVFEAATADVMDLIRDGAISVGMRPWAERPGGVEIVLTEHRDTAASVTVTMGLYNAGYRSHISESGPAGNPRVTVIKMSDLDPEPPIEMVAVEDLHKHLGRLVAFHRGRSYEVLGVGLMADESVERDVVVPAPSFNLLGRPNAPGSTMTIRAFVDDEYPVTDCPVDPAARAELIRKGHHLMPAEVTAGWPGSPDAHLRLARTLDEPTKAVWNAALTRTSDLLAQQKATMTIAPDGVSRLEIVVSGPDDQVDLVAARATWGLQDAGYEHTVRAEGPFVFLIHVTRPAGSKR